MLQRLEAKLDRDTQHLWERDPDSTRSLRYLVEDDSIYFYEDANLPRLR